jgi:hypothetical protein
MNVREETDEELAKSNDKSPLPPIGTANVGSPNDSLASPAAASASQHFFRVSRRSASGSVF